MDIIELKASVIRISKKYIRFRMRTGRGATFTAELTSLLDNATRAGALTILFKTYLNFLMPWWIFLSVYLLQKFIEYKIGEWDEVHGTWRYENAQNADLNPRMVEIKQLLEEIKNQKQT